MPFASIAAAVGGSLVSSMLAGDSADSAADEQGRATDAAIQEQRRQYNQNRTDLAPYRNVGGSAITKIGQLLGLGGTPSGKPYVPGGSVESRPILQKYMQQYGVSDWAQVPEEARRSAYAEEENSTGADSNAADYGSLNKKFTLADFWDDPVTKASYQSGLDQGTKALSNMAGARGNRNSGAQLKALERFGTDYTGQQSAASEGRFYGDQDRDYNRLAGVAGSGQTAATNTANMGTQTANTVGNLVSAQGNARGAAAISGGNALSGGVNSIGNWWQQQQTLDKLLNRGGSLAPGATASGGFNMDYFG